MLHALKKRAFRLQVPLDAALTPDSESLHLRHQLRQIRTQLQHLLQVHHSAAAIWLRLLHNQRNFSERIHQSYPNHDALSLICADLRAETARLSSQFAREQRPLSPLLAHIREQIVSYVTQIGTVEAMYARLDTLHAEYHRYKRKVDELVTRTAEHRFSPRRVPDDIRKSRNFSKLDRAEEEHKRMLHDVLRRQRKVFAVHAPLFHAALVAFWLSHASCVDALVDSLTQARQFAEAEQPKMKELDVKQLVEDADGEAAVSAHVGVTQLAFEVEEAQRGEAVQHTGDAHRVLVPTVRRSMSTSGSRTGTALGSRSSSAHTALQHSGVCTSVDVHEVHHIISRASLDAEGEENVAGDLVSPTGVQQVAHAVAAAAAPSERKEGEKRKQHDGAARVGAAAT